MTDNIANITTLTNEAHSRGSDLMDELISIFLIVRSEISRELAEVKKEMSKLVSQDLSHTTQV